ncbi:MAG: hypothetical protein KDC99_18865, partial [Cyclobacteriaceae bacterium]|nr:hypothetical protein [Cyclobacteriaceae bacterium]
MGHKRIFTIGRLVSYLFLCAGCEKDSGPGTTHLEIRITSPKNSSFYFKLNKIPFECEAYDSAGMPIEVDSVRWTS